MEHDWVHTIKSILEAICALRSGQANHPYKLCLDVGENYTSKEHLILLGRSFMATARTMVDVHHGKLTMTVLGEVDEFDVFTGKEEKELNTFFNVTTEETNATADEPMEDLEEFSQAFQDEVRILNEEKTDIIETNEMDVIDVNCFEG
ncbi:hypothetical protein Ddye_008171 [Dipteronia dyeriana]|uniref:Uncharacterized protein n=1 Tax=Dipteronia dyeriana TaxID=168575 RepID=A0AAE0CL38_9ROSI|nr:hypothetical protein Ddye_008171 [Dipteronia dyeriana]